MFCFFFWLLFLLLGLVFKGLYSICVILKSTGIFFFFFFYLSKQQQEFTTGYLQVNGSGFYPSVSPHLSLLCLCPCSMESKAYFAALLLNKHCEARLRQDQRHLDRQQRRMYNRVWRDKELLMDDYIHINVRTPSPRRRPPSPTPVPRPSPHATCKSVTLHSPAEKELRVRGRPVSAGQSGGQAEDRERSSACLGLNTPEPVSSVKETPLVPESAHSVLPQSGSPGLRGGQCKQGQRSSACLDLSTPEPVFSMKETLVPEASHSGPCQSGSPGRGRGQCKQEQSSSTCLDGLSPEVVAPVKDTVDTGVAPRGLPQSSVGRLPHQQQRSSVDGDSFRLETCTSMDTDGVTVEVDPSEQETWDSDPGCRLSPPPNCAVLQHCFEEKRHTQGVCEAFLPTVSPRPPRHVPQRSHTHEAVHMKSSSLTVTGGPQSTIERASDQPSLETVSSGAACAVTASVRCDAGGNITRQSNVISSLCPSGQSPFSRSSLGSACSHKISMSPGSLEDAELAGSGRGNSSRFRGRRESARTVDRTSRHTEENTRLGRTFTLGSGSACQGAQQENDPEQLIPRSERDRPESKHLGHSDPKTRSKSFLIVSGNRKPRHNPTPRRGQDLESDTPVEHDSASRQNDSTSRQNDSASRQNDSTSRQNDSTSRQNDSTSRQTDSTSRQTDSTSRQNDSTSRQTDSTSRQTDSTSRQNDSASRQTDSTPVRPVHRAKGKASSIPKPAQKAQVRQMTLDPKLVLPLSARRYLCRGQATITPVIAVQGRRATLFPNAEAKAGRVVTLDPKARGWMDRAAAILVSLEHLYRGTHAQPSASSTMLSTLTPSSRNTSQLQDADDVAASLVGSPPASQEDVPGKSLSQVLDTQRAASVQTLETEPPKTTASKSDTMRDDSSDVALVPQTIRADPELVLARNRSPEREVRRPAGNQRSFHLRHALRTSKPEARKYALFPSAKSPRTHLVERRRNISRNFYH